MNFWPQKRKVLLTKYDGELVIARAYYTQAGLIARWINNEFAWSLLLPTGQTKGTDLIVSWRPYSGFTPAELESFEKTRL